MDEVEQEISDTEKEKIREANISLIIDDYEDIFSDFDPRDYIERAISDDFIQECKRSARDKLKGIELRILVPKDKRNFKDEIKIKRRLRDHFKHHHEIENREMRKIIWEGISWFILGTIFILAVSWLHTFEKEGHFLLTVLTTMLEPAGWFSFWEGLGKVFIVRKERSENHLFYSKMRNAEINFVDY